MAKEAYADATRKLKDVEGRISLLVKQQEQQEQELYTLQQDEAALVRESLQLNTNRGY